MDSRCYALLSDGECNEGSIGKQPRWQQGQKVENPTAIVDYNKWQATGRSQEVMALEPLAAKWEAFGWHAQEIDGHNLADIAMHLLMQERETEKLSMIVAHTTKGKGVSYGRRQQLALQNPKRRRS